MLAVAAAETAAACTETGRCGSVVEIRAIVRPHYVVLYVVYMIQSVCLHRRIARVRNVRVLSFMLYMSSFDSVWRACACAERDRWVYLHCAAAAAVAAAVSRVRNASE